LPHRSRIIDRENCLGHFLMLHPSLRQIRASRPFRPLAAADNPDIGVPVR